MEYKGGVLKNKTTDIYTKVLKPALKNLNNRFPLQVLKIFIVDDYKYTFTTNELLYKDTIDTL